MIQYNAHSVYTHSISVDHMCVCRVASCHTELFIFRTAIITDGTFSHKDAEFFVWASCNNVKAGWGACTMCSLSLWLLQR